MSAIYSKEDQSQGLFQDIKVSLAHTKVRPYNTTSINEV